MNLDRATGATSAQLVHLHSALSMYYSVAAAFLCAFAASRLCVEVLSLGAQSRALSSDQLRDASTGKIHHLVELPRG